MRFVWVALVAGVIIAIRVMLRRRRSRGAGGDSLLPSSRDPGPFRRLDASLAYAGLARRWRAVDAALGDVGLVAMREIKERVRGRIFRVGTVLILVVVAAAIIIPTFHGRGAPATQTVGVVGSLSPQAEQAVYTAGLRTQESVTLLPEPSLAAAEADLRSSKADVAIINENQVWLNLPAASSKSPADPAFVQAVAEYLGVLKVYRTAGLTSAQATAIAGAQPLSVHTLQPGTKSQTRTTSVIGLVLLFFMLTQYNTWILIGVMQEKSSRVVEVLLAALRPIQLLGGKVLGIGLVALGQATVIVGFALIVGAAVGSDLLHGTAPLVLACQLLWLLLGYAFYCWVYAAGGSTAERQDQVQTLALPLSIPILLGYIFAITVASSGHASLFFKILAYVPLTAPFCMPVLVALNQVTWWEFLISVLISIAATVAMAMFAARIYRRAVLRTGGRVRLRELIAHR